MVRGVVKECQKKATDQKERLPVWKERLGQHLEMVDLDGMDGMEAASYLATDVGKI